MGLCQAINRLLNFHVVRFTRAVKYIPTAFVPNAVGWGKRDPTHLQAHPDYPDPECYLDPTQQYFFRHADLLHLRLEQYKRYFAATKETAEETGAPTERTRAMRRRSGRTTECR